MGNATRGKKAVSNVIVTVLSLVILAIVFANVILWNYDMNQLDWEKIREDMVITDVSRISSSSWFATQTEYTLNTGSQTGGSYTGTQTVDVEYESFTEGLNWWNASFGNRRQMNITNNAVSTLGSGYSVLLSVDTASLVSSGKMLPNGSDLRIVHFNASSWIEVDRDVIEMNTNSTQVWFKTHMDIPAGESNSNYYLYYNNPSAGSPPANKSNVYLWFDDFNRADNPDITTEATYSLKTGDGAWSIENSKLKNVGADGDPNKLIITALGNVSADVDMWVKINVTSFSGGDRSRMGLSCCMDADLPRGSGYNGLLHDDTNSIELLNDLRSWGTSGTYSWSLNTWFLTRFRVIDPASRLGKVKIWQAGTTEPDAWTVEGNFGGGAARSYGEVGFAGSRRDDTTYFDDILIRYIAEPEPSVSLSTEESKGDNRLDINGAFIIDLSTYPLAYIQTIEIQLRYQVSDTGEKWYLKAFNWTELGYSDNGFNFTEGQTPGGGWNTYAVNLTDGWSSYVHGNGTVNVKLVDEGADVDQTTLDADFLAVRAALDGANFTLHNKGSSTSHLVSLWINNSTHHRRYDVNIFINAGDTESYIRVDISLQDENCTVKVVTERGNIAVYSQSY